MLHPLASLAVIVLVGLCLVAYLFGFSAGRNEGHKQGEQKGHEEGKKEGRKEESIRAFAVGYDRGKRERDQPQAPVQERPHALMLFFIIVATVVGLSLVTRFLNRG